MAPATTSAESDGAEDAVVRRCSRGQFAGGGREAAREKKGKGTAAKLREALPTRLDPRPPPNHSSSTCPVCPRCRLPSLHHREPALVNIPAPYYALSPACSGNHRVHHRPTTVAVAPVAPVLRPALIIAILHPVHAAHWLLCPRMSGSTVHAHHFALPPPPTLSSKQSHDLPRVCDGGLSYAQSSPPPSLI